MEKAVFHCQNGVDKATKTNYTRVKLKLSINKLL